MVIESVALIKPADHNSLDPCVDPPHNLLVLGTQLEQAGKRVSIYDCGKWTDYEGIEEHDVFGVSLMTCQWVEAGYLLLELRSRYPKSLAVAGGCHATYCPESLLALGYDAVFVGESETSFVEWLGNPVGGIIVGREARSLNVLYPLDYGLLDMHKYVKREIGEEKVISTMLSRGCIYSCRFCSSRQKGIRYLSPAVALSDMERLLAESGAGGLFILDDIFTTQTHISKYLMGLLGLGVPWGCLGRAQDLMDKRLVDSLVGAGCRFVHVGVESGSQRMLDAMGKSVQLREIRRALENLARAQVMKTKISLIVGFPGETWETVEETVCFLEGVSWDVVVVNMFVPFPGTPVYEDPGRFGIKWLSEKWEDYRATDKHLKAKGVFATKDFSAREYVGMRNYVADHFKRRQQYYVEE